MTPRPGRGAHPSCASEQKKLELWGGVECTVNRVGDSWFDQTPRTGHETRVSDLELFADLGLKALRYPALWERISPQDPDQHDFRWTDERLPRIIGLGMRPIVTLCHHGTGPRYTSLVQESFAAGLARHAAAVAERYPWIEDWTPVNEPLTTARFSALYGYWYPHLRDEAACWLALINEIDATRLAMREVRKVNPRARLIQTDDLGYCHATAPLAAEAEFQNERRWLGWDLLCGMVKPGHALWDRLVACGLEDRLRAIADDPCPPNVIGVNHYLSSERFLDHRIERHACRSVADRDLLVSGGGIEHVDVDAIRQVRSGVIGLPGLLSQAWERYGRSVAVTECHHGGAREQQARWFAEVWNAVEELRHSGADIPAVTAWSLLGAHDWNRMVTRQDGHYEVGVFDVRQGEPRPTALAHLLKDLAAGRPVSAGWLQHPGWWNREHRFIDVEPRGAEFDLSSAERVLDAAPLLIVGAGGLLADLLVSTCEWRGLPYRQVRDANRATLEAFAPWAVVDARDWAGLCDDPLIEGQAIDFAFSGFAPPEALVATCAEFDIPCAVFSASSGFEEVDERLLAIGGPKLLLARTDALYSAASSNRFPVRLLALLKAGIPVEADCSGVWDEAYAPDVVDTSIDLLIDGIAGPQVLHPQEAWTAAEFARRLAITADCDPSLVIARPMTAPPLHELAPLQRPAPLLPSGEATIERFVFDSRTVAPARVLAPTPHRHQAERQAPAARAQV